MTRLAIDDTTKTIPFEGTSRRGHEIEVLVDENIGELSRRRSSGTKPLLSLDLLSVLVMMPRSVAVPLGRFEDYDRRRLSSGQRAGAVEMSTIGGVRHVTRIAEPPLAVRHVKVRSGRWRTGLNVASQFAPYASRELILDRFPSDELEMRLEADYLGIGVSVRDDTDRAGVRLVVPPAPFSPARYTGASWLFVERLLAQRTPLSN
ncbi:hypothetical protein [Arthrobacter sp. RAF14]|uniref:hypothetical protein n=1 Tax=Arthrobacter sp. RAF14 TaxID=3233051 RepID=UPI003F8F8D77